MSRQQKKRPEECPGFTKKWSPNGCGPKGGLLAKISAFLIPELIFGGACNCHDFAYFFGGCKSIDDSARYKADREFLLDMESRIDSLYRFRRPYYRKIAQIYFKSVRNAGQDSFNWFPDLGSWVTHLVRYDIPVPDYLALATSTEKAREIYISKGEKIEVEK